MRGDLRATRKENCESDIGSRGKQSEGLVVGERKNTCTHAVGLQGTRAIERKNEINFP